MQLVVAKSLYTPLRCSSLQSQKCLCCSYAVKDSFLPLIQATGAGQEGGTTCFGVGFSSSGACVELQVVTVDKR